jgi:predicted nucleic acid-binding protein
VTALNLLVDAGEASAMALAIEKGLRVILDDEKGRQTALAMGLQVTGTFGLLLKAKEFGVVASVTPLLEALDRAGFHSSRELREKVLRLAGE